MDNDPVANVVVLVFYSVYLNASSWLVFATMFDLQQPWFIGIRVA